MDQANTDQWETFKYLSTLPNHKLVLGATYTDKGERYLKYDLYYSGTYIDSLTMKFPVYTDKDEQGYQDLINKPREFWMCENCDLVEYYKRLQCAKCGKENFVFLREVIDE